MRASRSYAARSAASAEVGACAAWELGVLAGAASRCGSDAVSLPHAVAAMAKAAKIAAMPARVAALVVMILVLFMMVLLS
ncbi:MAG TPA: hypothetical protein DEQ43_14405 [Nocardioides bacterium]|nr:hypothetical protein [Nocardioides sp.]